MSVILLLVLNLFLSTLNAWGCGVSWQETKRHGGVAHLMNWMGATMAASGFSWCFLIISAFIAHHIPYDGHPLLDIAAMKALLSLGYLVILPPVLGSGVAILIHSWVGFAKERDLASGLAAGWNTYAMGSNVYHAMDGVPKALDTVGDFFTDNDDLAELGLKIVIGLLLFSVAGGILTTYLIITRTARRHP